jgi:hypothetical protein
MKKLAILLTMLLLIGLFAGCAHSGNKQDDKDSEKLLNYPAPVSEKKIEKIEKDYAKKFDKEFKLRWTSENEPYGDAFYCGSDSGYDILVFRPNPGGLGSAGVSVFIGGDVEFPQMNSQSSLYAYQDGEFIKLADAYEDGLITKEGLQEASEQYKNGLELKYDFPSISEGAPENSELDDAILKAYCELNNIDLIASVKELQVRHYAQVDDLYAFYVDGLWDYTQAIRRVTLFEKFHFIFPTGQKMYLYRNGRICALDDAEQEEFATLKEIHALWVHYDEKVNSRYQDGSVTE